MARKPNRIDIVEYIDVNFDGQTLEHVIAVLRDYINRYGPETYFDYDVWPDGVAIRIAYYRLESDKEYEARCAKLKKEAEMAARERDARLNRDRKEYERLKKKFEIDTIYSPGTK